MSEKIGRSLDVGVLDKALNKAGLGWVRPIFEQAIRESKDPAWRYNIETDCYEERVRDHDGVRNIP